MLLGVYSEVVRHWWNRTWGRLNRRDVFVRTDGVTFELEMRLGGPEGRQWLRVYPTLETAVAEAEQHMAADQGWADISRSHHLDERAALAVWRCGAGGGVEVAQGAATVA